VADDPRFALRRLAPDPVQFQVILGSLLGDGSIVGEPFDRRLRVAHAAAREDYVWWKYDRLGPLAADAPAERDGRLSFTTIAHPLFDDLATLPRKRLMELIAPLGLAVWMTDVGRLQLRADAFLPAQRRFALAEGAP
jgi:LAGLIDADG DNA endonuclease family protein